MALFHSTENRKSRALPRLAAMMFLLAAVSAATVFYIQHNASSIAKFCVDKLAGESGLRAEFEQVSVSLLPTPTLVIEELRLRGGEREFPAGRLHLTPDLVAVFRGALQCKIKLDGVLPKDETTLPWFLSGTISLPDKNLRRIVASDMLMRLDDDEVILDAVLTLGDGFFGEAENAPAENTLHDGPRIVVVPAVHSPQTQLVGQEDGSAQNRGDSADKALFGIKGTLRIQRLSLTRWLGFGRLVPPGIQWALDEVTDGMLEFSLNEKGLEVPSIAACSSGACFSGSGGVKSWDEPRVELDLTTERLNLLTALPEAAGSMPQPPRYAHAPLTPVPGAPLKQGETGVNYDIRLGAKLLDYGPLLLEEAKVVIHEGKMDENGLEDLLLTATGGLYGGSVQAEAVFGGGPQHPYAITARIRDVRGKDLARALDVIPVQSGRVKADVGIRSQGHALSEFLEKLTGKVEVGVSQGALRALPSPKDKTPSDSGVMSFDSLSLALNIDSAVFEKDKELLGLSGQWSSLMNAAGYSLRSSITGTLYFGNDPYVSFQNRPGKLSLHANATQGHPPLAELAGNFSRAGDKALVSVSNGHLVTSGVEVKGDMQVTDDKTGVSCAGTISARFTEATRFAALFGERGARIANGLRGLTLTANVRVNKREASFADMRANIDGTKVRGSLAVFLDPKPFFEFKLDVEEFTADRFFTKNEKNAQRADKAWDLRFMRDVRAKGVLHVGKFKFWRLLLKDVDISALLENGRLSIAPLSADIYGGVFSGTANAEFNKGVYFDGRFSSKGADIATVSREIAPNASLVGKMDFSLNLTGRLTGVDPAAKALNGDWRFVLNGGSWQKLDKNGEPKGKPTFFETAGASGTIKEGVARSDDFVLRGKGLVIDGGGFADFNNDTLDCNFVVNMEKFPDIPVRLHGDFQNSKTSISVGKVILNTIGGIPKGVFDILGDAVQGAWKLIR
jgi:AsmA protein